MFRFLKTLIPYIIILAAAAGAIWYYQSHLIPTPQKAYVPIPPVTVISPRIESLTESITLGGYSEAKKIVTILPQVGGRINSLYAEEGRRVFSGDLLAVIDKTSYQLQADQAEAVYLSAKSGYERVKSLFESGAATQQNYDQARAQYDNYRTQYELAKLQLTYTNITSPVTGTVLSTHTTEGALVGLQIPIATIADLNQQQIRINVPETYYDLFLKESDQISITLNRPGSRGEISRGKIIRIASFIDPESRSFEAVCSIANPSDLRPGMFVEVTCILKEYPNQYALPYETLVSGDTLWYVNPAENTAHRVSVVPLVETEDRFAVPVEMKDLLIIKEGQHFLRDGQIVHINYGDGKQEGGQEP
ncbi:MAG: efflux RND transporter periplasmic adaptor subunit [Spirochaetales bacterium]|jgi:membrane fusion protein (multidrug efflux system)|nr:efflux RND transporter periplasmic adaptor subunit [Spirochaetales bacterium]